MADLSGNANSKAVCDRSMRVTHDRLRNKQNHCRHNKFENYMESKLSQRSRKRVAQIRAGSDRA